ncbi:MULTISPECIES: filamentous hemagglutinin N-terminal domain-containing protein [unclassified Acinetobacter]|uniref:two-partner secretion domain-containing protein n=1 Tax=unclassified Acinetobacter TaxID=196816 RepID=UPI00190A7A12|nr:MULTISPECIES: filamentous hemagglutinin N-terminal domain-containing protein [unclassified Acinetobacter]MBK0063986.1 filamentous hemagglutinin N-terminal domain-containing protein [Acinetobacter sp. S55]MBK0067271.1 filamentous hemagglutinin N-terminal domain-containing protein [Acinetobacter sp. S54]
MNKNRYRIIFSQTRGMFIAVAEIVKSKTKQAGQSQAGGDANGENSGNDSNSTGQNAHHFKKLKLLNFAVISVLGASIYTLPLHILADSQIIADKAAPTSQQPTILSSSNGVMQVNIQTPSAGGVSRNTYSQFDVGQEGAILNNARNNTQTQLGGWVQGNPWLAKGEANIILNEVNSSNPSQLKGYIEVAGKQAQVVIANPSGLVCDGCGVINADRFTLTTGQAVMNQGYLESFRVREGQITIQGKGLNGSLTPFTDVYARALQVNAGLYANELKTVLGQNDINIQDPSAPKIAKVATRGTAIPQPNFALDVGQLGGMYAGKIFLIGTEQGVGARNAGSINSTQSTLTLNANGDLINTGNMIANKDQLQLNAQSIKNTGNISSAASQVTVQSQNLDNSGLISSADEFHLTQQNQLSNSGTLNAARLVIDAGRLSNSGSLEQTGAQALDLTAGSMSNAGGKIGLAKTSTSSTAPGNTGGNTGNGTGETGSEGSGAPQPSNPAQDGGSIVIAIDPATPTVPKTYDTGYIHVQELLNNDQGAIVARGGIDLDSSNGLNNQSGMLNLGAIKVQGDSFNNDQGQLTVQQADIQTQILSNQSGQLAANKSLKIKTETTNNQKGHIQAVEQLDLDVVKSLNNREGQIASGHQLNVQAAQVNNQSGLLYSGQQGINLSVEKDLDNTSGTIQAKTQLNINSQSLNNASGAILAQNIQQQHDTVNNTQGNIVSEQNLRSIVSQFDNNEGQIQAQQIELTHQQLNNSGSIYADQDLSIIGQNLQNTGSIAAGQNVQLDSQNLQHQQSGLIAAGLDRQGKLGNGGHLEINADQAALHGQSFAGQDLIVQAQQQIDASQGQLQAKNIEINSQAGNISTRAATVIADQLNINSHDLIDNQQGTLSAKDLILNASRLDNTEGHLLHTSTDRLDLNFSQSLNNQSGEIRSNAAQLHLNTAVLNNTAGQLIHAGTGQFNIQTDQLQGNQGQILSNGQLQLTGRQLDLSQGITSAEQIAINAQKLNNRQGQLIQRGTESPLTLGIQQELNNQMGLIQSQTALNISAGTLNNQGGTLSSAQLQDLNLQVTGLLDNSHSGKIYANQHANIQAGSVDNSHQGQINAQQKLNLTSQQQINNQTGQIVANADIQIQSQGLDNSEGQIGSVQGELTLDAGTGILSNQSGSLQAAKDIQITAGQFKSQSGLINAQGAIQATINKDIDNSLGQIIANKAVQLNSQGLNNHQGQIGSVEDILSINTGQGVLSNQQGKLQSTQDLTLKAKGFDNQSGLIATQAQLDTQQQWLSNNNGQIISGQSLNLRGQDFSNQGGLLQSGQDLNFKLGGKLDNSQSGQLISAGNTQIESKQLGNSQQGLINAQGDLNITTQQEVNNAAGSIVAKNNVQLNSQGLNNNQGQIGTELGDLNIQTGQQALDNLAGQIQSGKTLEIKTNSLNNSGVISALNTLAIESQTNINNDQGQIASNAQLNMSSNNLSNQSGLIQTGDKANLNLTVKETLNNQSGQIHSGADHQIIAQQIDNNGQGQITAQGGLNIYSQSDINNQTGQLIANGQVQLHGEGINNNQGQIGSLQDQVIVKAGQGVFSNQSGNLQSNKDLTVDANRIDNQQGQINSQSKIELKSQQDIHNLEGLIAGDLGLTLNSQSVNNNKGQFGSAQGDVTINAEGGALTNQAGVILSGKALSVTANQLDNSTKGQINSQNTLDITTTKDINNNSGVIAANQQLKLNSQGLNNSAGQIGSVQGNLLIDTGSQLLNNQQGVIQSGNDSSLKATGVNNAQGQISSKNQLQLDSREKLLNNHQGTLSAENINIDSGKLDNDQGLIQAQQSIRVDTHQQDLINTHSGQQGGILSQGDIQLNNIQTLDNQQGYLASGKQLDIQANQVLNQQGTLLATEQLNIQGTGQNQLLNNQSGQLLSMGGMTLNIDRINNTGKASASDADSHIMAAGELNITTQQLDNQNTLNSDPTEKSIQGIDANDLNINSNILNNQSGVVRSSSDQKLNVKQQLNNQSGQISSEKQLTILGNPLVINNLNGQLLAGTGFDLTAKALSGDGKVLSLGNANLRLQEDYVHNANAQLQANQDLRLSTQSNIVNNGSINAGNRLDLSASNITNNQDGKIESHETRLTAQNNLNNTGLINGDYTRLQANILNNEGTGRIYGTALAINANTLNNRPNSVGVAPVIASRGDMHLGVQTLNNLANTADYASQALIFSAGSLYLGGSLDNNDQATGQAEVIHNESATIESLCDMRLSANQINNINQNFESKLVETDRQDNLEKFYMGVWKTFNGEVIRWMNPNEDWSKYVYSEIRSETKVTKSTPGQIKSGGNLSLDGAQVFNDKSQILAGGTLSNTGGSIKNNDIKGVQHVVATGRQYLYENKSHGSHTDDNPFEYRTEQSIDLVVSQALGNQSLNQNEISITTVSNNQSDDKAQSGQIQHQEVNDLKDNRHSTQVGQAQNAQGKNLNVADSTTTSNNTSSQTTQQNPPSQQSKNLNLAVDEPNTQQQGNSADQAHAKTVTEQATAPDKVADGTAYEIRTLTSTEVRVPNSALYKVNADSKAGYLVETDPSFTHYRNWLSSDYMLDALGLDPALQQKRLGDGFYEQRMVQDQIANLTGYRFLEGYTSDDEQYKALMNNGVTFAKLYGLRPGIALTAQQAAQLTSDIVWMVEQTVILPNGMTTKALVPQIYVKARVGDLKGDGTLLSGNSVNLKLDGDLINGATIAGREAVQITADNVQNLNGRIQGNQVAIETKQDLNNAGGKISAKDAMALKVGGNLNLETTTRTSESKVGNFSSSITNVDRVAGIYVGQGSQNKLDPNQASLVMDVAGNTILKGAQINNSNGATLLNTAGNVDIGTVTIGKQEKLSINDKNGYQLKQQQDIGSQISSAGSLAITGQNILGKAVNLNSQQGNIQLSAQKDIVLDNGLNQSSVSSQSESKGSFGSKKSSTYDASSSTSIATQMKAGQDIILNSAQGNITATHLKAEAGNNIQIQAQQGNVTLLSAIDDKRESSTSSKKGVATYNNRQSGYIDQDVAQTTLKAGNTVDINAAKNIELQANDVKSGNSIYVGNTLMQRQADGTLKSADGSLMPENVTLSTLATKDEQWDEQQKGYRGIAKELIKGLAIGAVGIGLDDPVKIGESKGERSEQTLQQGTSLQANNIAVGSIGQTTLTSSDLSATNISLSGQKVILNAAEEQSKHSSSQGEETIQGLGVKLNNDSLRLGGFKTQDTTQSTTTTITTHKAGQINTENLNIQGVEGIDILGQNVKATGDTVLDHGRGELNIGGYENKTVTEDKTHTETVTSEVGVRNAYVDAALAVKALADATKGLSNAKKDYSQAQKDYAAGKITKDALDDSKTNLAMATTNVATAEIAVAASAAAAVAAASTSYGTGFTIGANGERIETTTATTTTEGQWQGSTLDLNNLTLKSEGQNANIQGSRLTATGTTSFEGTQDLNITAGTEHNSQSSNSKTNSQSVSYTYNGGGSASIGKQTSTSESNSLSHVNSEVNLSKTEGRLSSLNIKGGEVSIQDRGNLTHKQDSSIQTYY